MPDVREFGADQAPAAPSLGASWRSDRVVGTPAGVCARVPLADLRRVRSSPLVRKIAKEHGVDIAALNGTGISGRVTKKDILSFVEGGGAKAAARPVRARDSRPCLRRRPRSSPARTCASRRWA